MKQLLQKICVTLLFLVMVACAPTATTAPSATGSTPVTKTTSSASVTTETKLADIAIDQLNHKTVKLLACTEFEIQVEMEGKSYKAGVQNAESLFGFPNEQGITSYGPGDSEGFPKNCLIGQEVTIWQTGSKTYLYEVGTPTAADTRVEGFWAEYLDREKQISFPGELLPRDQEPGPLAKCSIMESASPLTGQWSDFPSMFATCTGQNMQPGSLAVFRGVFGINDLSVSTSGTEKNVATFSFLRKPNKAVVLGTLTPCDKVWPDLPIGLTVENVTPAPDDWLLDYWQFPASAGLAVNFKFNGLAGYVTVIDGGYFGFMDSANVSLPSSWDGDYSANQNNLQGIMYTYKVSTDCKQQP